MFNYIKVDICKKGTELRCSFLVFCKVIVNDKYNALGVMYNSNVLKYKYYRGVIHDNYFEFLKESV